MKVIMFYVHLNILKAMALYQASDFSGFSAGYAVPSDVSDVLFTGPVDNILSTGLTQQVFGSLSTAMKCIHFMKQSRLCIYHRMKILLRSVSIISTFELSI